MSVVQTSQDFWAEICAINLRDRGLDVVDWLTRESLFLSRCLPATKLALKVGFLVSECLTVCTKRHRNIFTVSNCKYPSGVRLVYRSLPNIRDPLNLSVPVSTRILTLPVRSRVFDLQRLFNPNGNCRRGGINGRWMTGNWTSGCGNKCITYAGELCVPF